MISRHEGALIWNPAKREPGGVGSRNIIYFCDFVAVPVTGIILKSCLGFCRKKQGDTGGTHVAPCEGWSNTMIQFRLSPVSIFRFSRFSFLPFPFLALYQNPILETFWDKHTSERSHRWTLTRWHQLSMSLSVSQPGSNPPQFTTDLWHSNNGHLIS